MKTLAKVSGANVARARHVFGTETTVIGLSVLGVCGFATLWFPLLALPALAVVFGWAQISSG